MKKVKKAIIPAANLVDIHYIRQKAPKGLGHVTITNRYLKGSHLI